MTKTFRVGMTFLFTALGLIGAGWALDVAGVVADEAGKPVADAKVVVLGPDRNGLGKDEAKGETSADTEGKFAIALKEGGFEMRLLKIIAIHPNYGISILHGYSLIQDGKTLLECRVVMPKRGCIQGKVTDTADKPVKDAEITVLLTSKTEYESYIQDIDKTLLSAKTNADGVFILDGLSLDTAVIVRASHPDYVSDVVGMSDGQQNITGTIKAGSTDILLSLQPGATLEGKITREGTGVPVSNVFVRAVLESVSPKTAFIMPDPVKTDEKGVFYITGLPPGKSLLSAGPFNDGVIASRTIEVAQASKLTWQNLTATRGVLISGKFVNADTREPVGRGSVQVFPKNTPSGSAVFEIKPDGTFEGHMMPGEVTLTGTIQHGYLTENYKTLALVAGQDQTGLIFEVKPPLTFRGKVLDTDGKPVAGARVFSRQVGTEAPVTSNQEGYFEIPLPSNIGFFARETFFFEAVSPDNPGLRGMLGRTIQGEEDLKGEIILTPVGIIRGKVVDKNGNAVASAKITKITWFDGTGMYGCRVDCDATGQFEIKDVIAGMNYEIDATADGYGKDRIRSILVQSGKTTDVRMLTLPVADKFIEGEVTDEDGKPLDGVSFNYWGDNMEYRSAYSNEKGQFRLDNLVDEMIRIDALYSNAKGSQRSTRIYEMAGVTDLEVILESNDPPCSLVGQEAFPLNVAAWIAGERISLESLRGAPVILAFCRNENEISEALLVQLNQIHEKYPKIPVLAIYRADTDQAVLKKSLEAHHVKFRVAVDKPGYETGATAGKYRARGTAVYLIGVDGKVRYQDLALSTVEKALQSMLDGK